MVAGALKNPWAFPGPAVRLDEAFLSDCSGGRAGREVESFFGDSAEDPFVIPDWNNETDSEGEYLYIEELPGKVRGKV